LGELKGQPSPEAVWQDGLDRVVWAGRVRPPPQGLPKQDLVHGLSEQVSSGSVESARSDRLTADGTIDLRKTNGHSRSLKTRHLGCHYDLRRSISDCAEGFFCSLSVGPLACSELFPSSPPALLDAQEHSSICPRPPLPTSNPLCRPFTTRPDSLKEDYS